MTKSLNCSGYVQQLLSLFRIGDIHNSVEIVRTALLLYAVLFEITHGGHELECPMQLHSAEQMALHMASRSAGQRDYQ